MICCQCSNNRSVLFVSSTPKNQRAAFGWNRTRLSSNHRNPKEQKTRTKWSPSTLLASQLLNMALGHVMECLQTSRRGCRGYQLVLLQLIFWFTLPYLLVMSWIGRLNPSTHYLPPENKVYRQSPPSISPQTFRYTAYLIGWVPQPNTPHLTTALLPRSIIECCDDARCVSMKLSAHA